MRITNHISSIRLSDDELNNITNLVKNIYGFDFENYSSASLKRRVERILTLQKQTVFDLLTRLTNDHNYFQHFLDEVTVNVTEMFRDPTFFKAFRTHVIPYLASYPHLKTWIAGCSTGEELYSYAILFEEENLYERVFLYGTDVNHKVLEHAKTGIYNLNKVKLYTENYLASGSRASLSNYYTANYGAASLSRRLKKNVLFAMHNLVSDGPFNEFQLISCRNVLIYFDIELQNRVLNLFYESLGNFGFLCLGSKESIRNIELLKKFKTVDKKNNIYQKIG